MYQNTYIEFPIEFLIKFHSKFCIIISYILFNLSFKYIQNNNIYNFIKSEA